MPPYTSEIAACIAYESRSLAANRVDVCMEHPVDALAGCGADEVIVATGPGPSGHRFRASTPRR